MQTFVADKRHRLLIFILFSMRKNNEKIFVHKRR